MNIFFKKSYCLSLLVILITSSGLLAQNATFNQIKQLEETNKNNEALLKIEELMSHRISMANKAQLYFYKAKAYDNQNMQDEAFQNYLKAKNLYLACGKKDLAIDINLDIAYLLSCFKNAENLHQSYIKEYMDYAITTKNNAKLLRGYATSAALKINAAEAKESLSLFHKALQLNKKVNDSVEASSIYNNISVLFSEVLNQPDSSLYYLKKNEAIVLAKNDQLGYCYNLQNQAAAFFHLKQYKKAIELLQKADNITGLKYNKGNKRNLNEFLYQNYKADQDYKNALFHLETSKQYQDSVNEEEQEIAVNDINIKYKTKDKEIENLKLKSQVITNRIFIGVVSIVLLAALIFGILFYKNLQKEKKIVEQEKQIETQRLEKNLKDQELLSIDLMLESQEKERQHIANELHDKLGSLLVTLKLNFQSLKLQNETVDKHQNELYDKTDALLEEAYQEVRSIAHLKNLGVIGSDGLVSAVNQMAKKMSVLEKIRFNVYPFGLEQRLENKLEVFIFRIIQELCTNIIKHAIATEINIYLTQHDTSEINIIIEDNGKGFDPIAIKTTQGIGLKNIQKKIEQLGGDFTIDSILTKGTTIVINLPI